MSPGDPELLGLFAQEAAERLDRLGDGDPVRHVAADAWPPAEPPAPPPWPPAGGSVAAPAASWGTAANGHGHGHGGGLADGGNGHAAGEVPHPRP